MTTYSACEELSDRTTVEAPEEHYRQKIINFYDKETNMDHEYVFKIFKPLMDKLKTVPEGEKCSMSDLTAWIDKDTDSLCLLDGKTTLKYVLTADEHKNLEPFLEKITGTIRKVRSHVLIFLKKN